MKAITTIHSLAIGMLWVVPFARGQSYSTEVGYVIQPIAGDEGDTYFDLPFIPEQGVSIVDYFGKMDYGTIWTHYNKYDTFVINPTVNTETYKYIVDYYEVDPFWYDENNNVLVNQQQIDDQSHGYYGPNPILKAPEIYPNDSVGIRSGTFSPDRIFCFSGVIRIDDNSSSPTPENDPSLTGIRTFEAGLFYSFTLNLTKPILLSDLGFIINSSNNIGSWSTISIADSGYDIGNQEWTSFYLWEELNPVTGENEKFWLSLHDFVTTDYLIKPGALLTIQPTNNFDWVPPKNY